LELSIRLCHSRIQVRIGIQGLQASPKQLASVDADARAAGGREAGVGCSQPPPSQPGKPGAVR
jgi:hypothetical protein